jgi:hypothetical protein
MNATRQAQTPARPSAPRPTILSRKCACGDKDGSSETCEECKGKRLQARSAGANQPRVVPPSVHEVLQSSGQPLDRVTRHHFEARLGHDLGAVRIHTDARAQASARDVNALAYTVGPHIAFAAGQYQPGRDAGRPLIAHELVHTIQQGAAIGRPRNLSIDRSDSPAEAEAERIAATISEPKGATVARAAGVGLARQAPPRDIPPPSPAPPQQDARQSDEFKDVGKSQELGRAGETWGWGSPETNNVYHECRVAELERTAFVAFAKSLPRPARRGRDRPLDAEDVLGITSFDPNKAVAPEIAAQPISDGGKTVYKLKPTHAEMPPIRSAATKAGEYVEGTRQYVEDECKGERLRLGTSKFPIHWTLTPDGAQKIKEAELEHCNDIRLAFDLSLGLYASGINNVAAAERTYSTERQAISDAVKSIDVQPSDMMLKFYQLAIKTRDRDDQNWHTANQRLPSPRHRQKPSKTNGCRHMETIDASSWPDVGDSKHSSESVLSDIRQAGGSGGGHHPQAHVVASATPRPGETMTAETSPGSVEQSLAPATQAAIQLPFSHEFGQMRVHVARAEAPGALEPAPDKPRLDFADLADRIRKAIAGLGTDEEAVYRALQALDRDPEAINELMQAYRRRHGVSLVEDIRDDFSGSELEFALQLLNLGTATAAQKIEKGSAATDARTAAWRIRQAVEGPGTDEEAVYAALLPFRRDTLAVQNAYQDLYGEDLRDRITDEMSGSERDYALSLLETPYEHYLHEGNSRLAGAPFGEFGKLGFLCLAEEQDLSSGSGRTYWYDRNYWEPGIEITGTGKNQRRTCKVKLLSGKSAAEAIDQMFEHQGRWKIACAEFVQIVHLYALRHVLGAKRFDQAVGEPFTLEVKRRESTGVRTRTAFTRASPNAPMTRSDSGTPDPRGIDAILATASIGARVRWTNLDPRAQGSAWENENTIKLGPDKFAAHGTASGIFSQENTHSRAEVELLTARGTDPKADASYVGKNIFISEIEIFENPDAP